MILEKIKGSLVGGAIGDALGYTVEFDRYDEIVKKFGKSGITRLQTRQSWLRDEYQVGKAVVSDDTQMTLFTSYGLLDAKRKDSELIEGIQDAYLDWYCTQCGAKFKSHDNWLAQISALNVRRAPGMTCMSALEYIYHGMEASNDSKGCGGVMRVAPIGLWAAATVALDDDDVIKLASQAARITHHHPLGYIPAGIVAHLVYKLALETSPTRESLVNYVFDSLKRCHTLFSCCKSEIDGLCELLNGAIELARGTGTDVECIHRLGEGWVGDEAIAIALFCVLRHFDSYEDMVIAAVNHNGDSDSTGAVAGNMLGAALGYSAIPQHFIRDIELHDLLVHMAQCLNDDELRMWQ